MRIVENKYKVGQFEADLTAKAGTGCRNGTGSTPRSVRKSRDDETAAKSSRSEEAGFENSNDGEALGVCEYGRRNNLVGTKGLSRVDERGENLAALLTFRCEEVMMSAAEALAWAQLGCYLHAMDDGRGL